jgi:hypothetical protein
MVCLPFTFDHVPYLVLLLVLARVIFLLKVDSIMVLGDVVDYCLVTHAFEDGASAYGTPAIICVNIIFEVLLSSTYASLGC